MRSPLVIGLGTPLTLRDEIAKAFSNSRRANAASVHSAGVGAGVPGAVPAARGLTTASTTLEIISDTVSMEVGIVAVVVLPCAGSGESLTSGARCLAALVSRVVEAANTAGLVAVGVGTALATTRAASTVLAGAVRSSACRCAATEVRVFFAALEPDTPQAVANGAGAPLAAVAAPVCAGGEPVGAVVFAPPELRTAIAKDRFRGLLRGTRL